MWSAFCRGVACNVRRTSLYHGKFFADLCESVTKHGWPPTWVIWNRWLKSLYIVLQPYAVPKACMWISWIWFILWVLNKQTCCISPNTWQNWIKSSASGLEWESAGHGTLKCSKIWAFACAWKMRSPNGKQAVALSIWTQIKYGSEYYDTIMNVEGMVFLELSKSFGFGFSGKQSDLSLLSSKHAVTPSVLP